VLSLVLSAGACNDYDRVPIPPPEEVGAEPFPDGVSIGGLDVTFGPVRPDGVETNCGGFYRFEPDGTVAQSGGGCPEEGESFERFLQRLFDQPTARRGDYAVLGQHVWMRLVERDLLAQEMLLELVEAEVCGDQMMLRPPGEPFGAWAQQVRSDYELVLGDPPATAEPCDVPRFSFDRRNVLYSQVRNASFTVVTDPGRTCAIEYESPDGQR
jgi:hypothetical protein